MLFEHTAAIDINLNLPLAGHPRPVQSKIESANSGEK
jgi:hypothetical protein